MKLGSELRTALLSFIEKGQSAVRYLIRWHTIANADISNIAADRKCSVCIAIFRRCKCTMGIPMEICRFMWYSNLRVYVHKQELKKGTKPEV